MIWRPRAQVQRARRMAVLARWLGPWADIGGAPMRVARRAMTIERASGPGSFESWVYWPPMHIPIVGAYALAPGLHFDGPADPRMDRFCRVLAGCGYLVISPFIADFMDLRATQLAVTDYQAAIRAIRRAPGYPTGARPWLFSISFGSLLALRAASSPGLRDEIGGVVAFGGYADWRALVQFCLTGRLTDGSRAKHHDPLNRPVVYLTMLDAVLACAGVDRTHAPVLTHAWQAFVRRTWSRAGQARATQPHRVAQELAAELPDAARALFLMGCGPPERTPDGADGASDPGVELCTRALERFDGAHLDVRASLPDIRCPVHITHGVEDDVIPVEHARALAAALPKGLQHGLYITGLYGHTARAGFAETVPLLGREAGSLTRLIYAIASA